MASDTSVLWIEDEPEKTNEIAGALRKAFTLCKAPWSVGPTHHLSDALRYLIQADLTGEVPFPDVILVDSALDMDPHRAENEGIIRAIAGASPGLLDDAIGCLSDGNGGGVLRLIGRHFLRARPSLRIVYVSKYSEEQIKDLHGGNVLNDYPGVLSGYFWKNKPADALVRMLFEITGDSRRALGVEELRAALLPADADYLLGSADEGYQWSAPYRLALTDLVRAGGDRAVLLNVRTTESGGGRWVESTSPVFDEVRRSHKQLPRALILAERGAGKEGFSRALHNMWHREVPKDPIPPLITVNVGGVPPWSAGAALQLRLFGGQQNQDPTQAPQPGCVPLAWNGTLFMDELGDASSDVQDTLLRLIQEGEYEPILWTRQVWAAHCSFIGATNRDLWADPGSTTKDFRADVADRLAMHVVRVPPLRDVKEDIPNWMTKIAKLLARDYNAKRGTRIPSEFEFPEVAANILQSYDWPGNIREFSHAVRRMQVRAASESRIPVDVVVTEVSRLKERAQVVTPGSVAGLPSDQSELDVFVTGAAEFARRNGIKKVSKEHIARHSQTLLGRTVRVYQLQEHFDRVFGTGGFDSLLKSVAAAAGVGVWGGGKTNPAKK